MNNRVVFCIPSFAGTPCREWLDSWERTTWLLRKRADIEYSRMLIAGDPYLSKVRNRLATEFLNEPNATDLFFLDDDIGWDEAAVLRFLDREEEVVAGVYPKKKDELDWPAGLEQEDGHLIERGGLYSAVLAPTGFLRIKRSVIETLAAQSGKYLEPLPNGGTMPVHAIFDMGFRMIEGQEYGQFWGEDWHFCWRWRGLGGKVWVDPDIAFTHRGSKAWAANFSHSVKAHLAQQAAPAAEEAA